MKKLSKYLFLLQLLVSSAAFSASFTCFQAETKIDKLICNNFEISELDDKLSIHYKNIIANIENKDAFKLEQIEWLKKRNKCQDITCVKDMYVSRVLALQERSKLYKKSQKSEILFGSENSICQDYSSLMKRTSRNSPQSCGLPYEFDERAMKDGFRVVNWKQINPDSYLQVRELFSLYLSLAYIDDRKKMDALASFKKNDLTWSTFMFEANIDINNDGTEELVYKLAYPTFGCNGSRTFIPNINELTKVRKDYRDTTLHVSGELFIYKGTIYSVFEDTIRRPEGAGFNVNDRTTVCSLRADDSVAGTLP